MLGGGACLKWLCSSLRQIEGGETPAAHTSPHAASGRTYTGTVGGAGRSRLQTGSPKAADQSSEVARRSCHSLRDYQCFNIELTVCTHKYRMRSNDITPLGGDRWAHLSLCLSLWSVQSCSAEVLPGGGAVAPWWGSGERDEAGREQRSFRSARLNAAEVTSRGRSFTRLSLWRSERGETAKAWVTENH